MINKRHILFPGATILCLFILQACQTRTDLAPVVTGNDVPVPAFVEKQNLAPDQTTYEVLPGESLYAIAKKFDVDYHALAKFNHIQEPYRIHAGQVLFIVKHASTTDTFSRGIEQKQPEYRPVYTDDALAMPAHQAAKPPATEPVALPEKTTPKKIPIVRKIEKKLHIARHDMPPEPAKPIEKIIANEPESVAPNTLPTAPTSTLTPVPALASTPASVSVPLQPVTSQGVADSVKAGVVKQTAPVALPMSTRAGWAWPVKEGYILKTYTARNKGMDIGVLKTQEVVAARAGTVVYAGVDLSGSGELVIIRHDDEILTAYSGATHIEVVEGQSVALSQKIGMIDASTHKSLHFDVRKQGESIDPMACVTAKS